MKVLLLVEPGTALTIIMSCNGLFRRVKPSSRARASDLPHCTASWHALFAILIDISYLYLSCVAPWVACRILVCGMDQPLAIESTRPSHTQLLVGWCLYGLAWKTGLVWEAQKVTKVEVIPRVLIYSISTPAIVH